MTYDHGSLALALTCSVYIRPPALAFVQHPTNNNHSTTQHFNQLHSNSINYLYLFNPTPTPQVNMSGMMDKVKAKVDQVMHKDKTHGKHFVEYLQQK
jgi:hypothetical protein